MRIRWVVMIVMIVFALGALSAHANSSWLNQIIKQHEKPAQKNKAEAPQKQHKGFFSEHGLVLFYASSCPHCHQLEPVLKRWADKHGTQVLPLAFDNQPLPEFPHFLPATTEWVDAAYQGAPIQYPALFVINPKTNALYPVSLGSMTFEELSYRMKVLIPKIEAYEHQEMPL